MSDFVQTRRYLPDGTLSVVDIGIPELFAIERSKDDPDHPCVPEARYALERHYGPKSKDGPIWALVNHDVGVYHEPPPGAKQDEKGLWWLNGQRIRVACLFGHVGNDAKDVEGCSAFGAEVPDWNRAWVSDSHKAVFAFQEQMQKVWTPDIGLVITHESTDKVQEV